jgi:hypothetical protein
MMGNLAGETIHLGCLIGVIGAILTFHLAP